MASHPARAAAIEDVASDVGAGSFSQASTVVRVG